MWKRAKKLIKVEHLIDKRAKKLIKVEYLIDNKYIFCADVLM